MKKININRINYQRLSLCESPLHLNKLTYPEVVNNGKRLVDNNGNAIGTKGDMYTKIILDSIIQKGTMDYNPRPKYIDFYENGLYISNKNKVITKDNKEIYISEKDKVIEIDRGIKVLVPAHTVSVNSGIETIYDLSKGESPLITLRPIATNASVAEIIWIYGRQSNDLVEFDELLGKNTWNQDHKVNNWWNDWALKDENGNYILNEKGHPTIGSCYGGTTKKWDMLYSNVIDPLKKDPDGRRNITCLWQYEDFESPHGLKPCAFLTIWNVRHEWDGMDYLDMTMIQRSSDFATAGCINQVQYVALLKMVARELNFEPGKFTWKPVNVQIYDRHIEQAIEMLNIEPINCEANIELHPEITNFTDFKPSDVEIVDYPKELIKKKNPQLKFPLGV